MNQKGVEFNTDPTAEKAKPPRKMDKRARAIWKQIADVLPDNWFSLENHALFRSFCEACAESERVDEIMLAHREAGGSLAARDYVTLGNRRKQLTADIINLSRQLRFSQQSRMRPETAGRATGAPKEFSTGADRISAELDQPWSGNATVQ